MDNISEMLKGVLDGIVLAIIEKEETYGYAIAKKLKDMDFLDIAEATVYSLLLRLERNSLVHARKKDSILGPPRKFYRLNNMGKKELENFWQRWDFLSSRVFGLKEERGVNDEH